MHRTLQEMVVKALDHKQHLTSQYWGLAYLHFAGLISILSSRDSNKSPYELWYGHPCDLSSQPLLPFGSIVMSHIPLEQQTSLSGRSIETIYVGRSPFIMAPLKFLNRSSNVAWLDNPSNSLAQKSRFRLLMCFLLHPQLKL